jgi:hypothetical protein
MASTPSHSETGASTSPQSYNASTEQVHQTGKLGTPERQMTPDEKRSSGHSAHDEENVLARLSNGRKNLLLVIFCSAMFLGKQVDTSFRAVARQETSTDRAQFYLLDAAGISAIFIMTAPISFDLNISLGQEAWVLTSYSLSKRHRAIRSSLPSFHLTDFGITRS